MTAIAEDFATSAEVAEAERAVLGACMAGWQRPDELELDSEDFYRPQHGDVWAAILRVQRQGVQPDPTSVSSELVGRKPPIDPVWLFDLASAVTAIGNAPYFAEKVREAAGIRAIHQAGIALQNMPPGNLEERREQARQRLDEACRGRVFARARRLADLLPETLDAAQSGKSAVLSTCWPDIDRGIGGLAPGRLVVFGARPGGGKSLAGTNLALHMAHHHEHAVLLASMEMPHDEVMNRLLAAHAGVDLTSLINGTVPDSDWDLIAAKHDELVRMPLFIDDSSTLTSQGLRRLARDVQRERDDLALIVVDYLQLMQPVGSRRNGSRAEEVSGIARDLKMLARETGACVVAMAQVNREGGKAEDGPRITDLREGGIENDADQVILLHRPDLELPEVTANVAKNRHGPQVVATLRLRGQYAQLASVAWTPSRGAA